MKAVTDAGQSTADALPLAGQAAPVRPMVLDSATLDP